MKSGSAQRLPQVTTGPTVEAGFNNLYFKSDNVLYSKNSAGVEIRIGPVADASISADKLNVFIGGMNLLTNSDFSDGLTGYDSAGTAVRSIVTSPTTYGPNAAKVTQHATPAIYPDIRRQIPASALLPSTKYTFSALVYIPASGGVTSGLYLTALTISGSPIAAQVVSGPMSTTGAWRLMSVTFTTSATPTGVLGLYVYAGGTPAAGTYFVTDSWQWQMGDYPTAYAPKPDEILPGAAIANITAGTTAQYLRGDKSWQTLNAASVGLSNVDNTSDGAKTFTASQLISGILSEARLGSGGGTSAKYLRGDSTWQVPTPAAVGLSNVVNLLQVDTTTAQTVAGIKTFSSSPIVPTPTTSTQAVPKGYVDTAIASVPTMGQEMGYAERTSNYTTTNTTAFNAAVKITSLSVTVTGTGRPVEIEFFSGAVQHSAGAVNSTFVASYLITNGSTASPNTALSIGIAGGGVGPTMIMKKRMVLTNGVSYTFEVGVYGLVAGTTTVYSTTQARSYLSVTQR